MGTGRLILSFEVVECGCDLLQGWSRNSSEIGGRHLVFLLFIGGLLRFAFLLHISGRLSFSLVRRCDRD